MMPPKRIGITLGDPAGIGPEVVLKTLSSLQPIQWTGIIYGDANCMETAPLKDLYKSLNIITTEQIPSTPGLYLKPLPQPGPIKRGLPTALSGQASFNWLEAATKDALAHHIDALVTAPISKTAWKLANISFTGHTTYLKSMCQAPQTTMAFYTPTLKVVLATIHIPLKDVSSHLTQTQLDNTLEQSVLWAQKLGLSQPKIAVAGLNPHAGEEGLLGTEEQNLIIPTVKAWQRRYPGITGPYPADTLFYRAQQGEFDLVVALYHDQGLIPIKLAHFDCAVNLTLGLPFIRTSPDHGTAYDIVDTYTASKNSMLDALKLALRLSDDT